MPTKAELQAGFLLGDWEVFPETGIIRRGDVEVSPEPQTWRVLIALAERDGGLVTRDDLVDEVWNGRAVADDPINRAIREVRKCFGDSAKESTYVQTLHKRGYRLLQPVQLLESKIPDETSNDVMPGASRNKWLAVVAIIIVGLLATVFIEMGPKTPPVKSIAILPFANLSGEESDEYLVSGFKEELVVMLASIEDMTVKPVRGDLGPIETGEIAKELGVESVLEGSLRREGDQLRISFRISKGAKGVTHSGEVSGSVSELFVTQERLANKVRNELLGRSSQILITSRPTDSRAYDSYMRGMYALQHRGDAQNLEFAVELFKSAIQLDKDYGPSYLGLATAYALMPDYRRGATERQPGEWNELAKTTVDEGVKRDPTIETAAGSIYGFVYHKQKDWQKSEAAHLKAVSGRIVDSNAFNWYSRMLASVGRMDDALDMALRAVEIDPSSSVINSRIAIMYTWLEDSPKAHEYFQRANDLGARGTTHILAYAFLLARDGQLERAKSLAFAGVQMAGVTTDWIAPVFDAFDDPEKAPTALAAIQRAASDDQLAPQINLTVRTLLGDIDGAMQVTDLLLAEGEAFEMDLLFIPELKALRQHPGFMPLLDKLNVTRYWASKNCVWAGDKLLCP
jgi:DNA-binding winged helix-turn-helix (wHTH) protein/TolB-like protein/Tfp pilus assembly protein PilF